MAKKGRLALSRRPLSPVSLASAELVGIFLNLPTYRFLSC